jgi:hypothetical protein
MRKKIVTATLITAAVLLGVAAAWAGQSDPSLTRRYPSGVPAATIQAVERLIALTGFDGRRNLLTRPFDEATALALLEALRSESFEVRQTALRLLDLTAQQLHVPAGYLLGVVRPEVEQFEKTLRGAPDLQSQELGRLARRVLWQIEVSQIPAGFQRAEFLKRFLDNREDGYYYPFQALDHLVALGTPVVREIMAAKIEESTRRSMSQKLVEQVQISVQKVDLLDLLEGLEPPAQVRLLSEAFRKSLPDQSIPSRGLRTWIIRQIAERDTGSAREFLRAVSQDESVDASIRYEAEESLASLRRRKE